MPDPMNVLEGIAPVAREKAQAPSREELAHRLAHARAESAQVLSLHVRAFTDWCASDPPGAEAMERIKARITDLLRQEPRP